MIRFLFFHKKEKMGKNLKGKLEVDIKEYFAEQEET